MLKPHVLHIINNLNVSGATTLLLDVASYVRPAPGELTVCTLEPENPMAQAMASTGARVISPSSRLNPVAALFFVRRVLAEIQPEIVHTHLLPATQVGLVPAKFARRRVVTTVHFTFERLTTNPVAAWLNRQSYRFYDAIYAISNAVKQSIIENCPVAEDSVKVLLSGVDFARASGIVRQARADVRRRIRQQCGFAEGDVVIGTIGRMEPAKGHGVLVSAFAALRTTFPAARLLLVGDGTCRPALERQAGELGLNAAVMLAGTQKDPDAFLAAMDVFVLPSSHEGLGLSIIEAMGAGLPVVGSTAGGIPEVVVHGETGLLFARDDPSALAACVRRLLESPELARTMASAGKAFAAQEFGIAGYVSRLYDEYDRVLHASQRSAVGRYARPCAPKEAAT